MSRDGRRDEAALKIHDESDKSGAKDHKSAAVSGSPVGSYNGNAEWYSTDQRLSRFLRFHSVAVHGPSQSAAQGIAHHLEIELGAVSDRS